MAILAGIGRALTSVGSDLQRNRLDREERERRFAELRDQRAYAEDVREQEAGIRADETQANRAYAREVEADRRTHARGVEADRRTHDAGVTAANRVWTADEFDRQAGVRADAARVAGDLASSVVAERRRHEQDQFEEGLDAFENVSNAGKWRGIPFKLSVTHPPATARDIAISSREGLSLAQRPRTTRVMPPEYLMRDVEGEMHRRRGPGAFDEAGNLIGDPESVSNVFNEASRIVNQDPRQPTVREPSMFTPPVFGAEAVGAARDAVAVPSGRTRRIQSAPDSLGGGLTPLPPPSGLTIMTDDEFQVLVESGDYTEDELRRIWESSTPGPGIR